MFPNFFDWRIPEITIYLLVGSGTNLTRGEKRKKIKNMFLTSKDVFYWILADFQWEEISNSADFACLKFVIASLSLPFKKYFLKFINSWTTHTKSKFSINILLG